MTYGPTLTVDETAEIMHIGYNSVIELINEGHLPAARLGKSHTLLMEDVLDYIRKTAAEQTRKRRESKNGDTIPDIPVRKGQRRRRLSDSLGI
jgi:excisionase family DNA binding protein